MSKKLIKLFVSDLDGCISHPFNPPNWNEISEIKEWNNQSDRDNTIPSLTLCTGRPLSYAEAVAQWLDVKQYIIFESGAGFYHPKINHLHWSKLIDPKALEYLNSLRDWAELEIVSKYPNMVIEFGKRADLGFVHSDENVIKEVIEQVEIKTRGKEHFIDINHTEVSINVLTKGVDKGTGIEWLSEYYGIGLDEMAYIGDGMNDVPAMKKCAFSFAPSNARELTKQAASHVFTVEATKAVFEAYKFLIEHNKKVKEIV